MTNNKEPHYFATTGKQMSLAVIATLLFLLMCLAFC